MKYKGIVIITGVSVREAKKTFSTAKNSDLIEYDGKKYKVNAGAGAAIFLNSKGYIVFMIGSLAQNLKIVGSHLKNEFYAEALDLCDEKAIKHVLNKVAKIKKEKSLDVHLVYYGSASDTKIKLPEDSIFISPWETPAQALSDIVHGNIFPWLTLMQNLRPIIRKQLKTNVIVISAVAAIRALPLALIDNVQKGAVHSMARSLALDLSKEGIYITEIMPGTTDTGFYDNEFTLDQVVKQGRGFGYEYKKDSLPIFSGHKVGEAVFYALEAGVHIREISMVAYGQIPHLGA